MLHLAAEDKPNFVGASASVSFYVDGTASSLFVASGKGLNGIHDSWLPVQQGECAAHGAREKQSSLVDKAEVIQRHANLIICSYSFSRIQSTTALSNGI